MKNRSARIALVVAIALLVCAFFAFDLGQYLTLDYIKSQQRAFAVFYAQNRILTVVTYMAIYVVVTALSLPGATIMTLAGGGLFGLWIGLLAVSFASTIGATLAFLVSRFLLHETVQKKFRDRLTPINEGIEKDGAFYLFSLRLVPIFPFFIINLLMGLTPLRVGTFYLVSQIGMLPGTFVYVNAGTQLGKIQSAAGILSPPLLLSFALLGIFPLVAKKLLSAIRTRRVTQRLKKRDHLKVSAKAKTREEKD